MLTCRIFAQRVDILAAGEADRSPSRGVSHEDDAAYEVLATAPPKRTGNALPQMTQQLTHDDTRSSTSQRDIFRSQRTRQDEPGPAREKTTIRPPEAKAAVTTI